MDINQLKTKLPQFRYSMLKHIIDYVRTTKEIDPHWIVKEVEDLVWRLLKFAFTGKCDHVPIDYHLGDSNVNYQRNWCRYCTQKIVPKIRVVEWEVEDNEVLPSPPPIP